MDLLLSVPKLHDLPLDFPRSARARVEQVYGELLQCAPTVVEVFRAFGRVLAVHLRAEIVVIGLREEDCNELRVVAMEIPNSGDLSENTAKTAIEEARGRGKSIRELAGDVQASFHPVCQSGVRIGRVKSVADTGFAPLDLELVVEAGEPLSLVYRADLLEQESAMRLLAQTWNALRGSQALDRDSDRIKFLVDVNATKMPWPEASCMHDVVLHSVEPEAVAMLYDLDRHATTYGGLLAAVTAMAGKFSRELAPDECVVLLVERDPSLIVAVCSVLLAGGCYVPLEPDYPTWRILSVAEDCAARVVVTQHKFMLKFKELFFHHDSRDVATKVEHVVCCDDVVAQTAYPHNSDGVELARRARSPATQPHHLVYVFYTSGTTGKPKGVMVEHRGLVRRMAWFQRKYPLNKGDAMLVKTVYTFGISEFELFWPLSAGAVLLVARPDGHKIASYVAELSKYAAAFCFVPSALAAVAEVAVDEHRPSDFDVKIGISCGEPLSAATATSFFEAFRGRLLSNVYGPTEADMTYFEISSLEQAKALTRAPPIGVPMDNVVVYLLDEAQRAVPVGAPGHLHFGAPYPARGYVGLPNAPNWINNPFYDDYKNNERVPECLKLYATGDLARWLPNGQLSFCGRVNVGQVKLRGFRIELDDVASALLSHPRVARSTASIVDAGTPRARLVGYIVSSSPPPNSPVDDDPILVANSELAADAHERAKEILPSYAAPSAVIELARLPVTARGKLDRSKLPVPMREASELHDFVESTTPTERAVEAVWQAVLGLDAATPISATADFVALGGNSLLAGRATTKLRHSLGGAPLPGTAMYMYPTISELAAFIDTLPGRSKGASSDGRDRKLIEAREAAEAEHGYYRGNSSTAPLSMIAQLFVTLFALVCSDMFAAPLSMISVFHLYRLYGAVYAALLVTPALSLGLPVLLGALAVMANRLLAPKFRRPRKQESPSRLKRILLWSRQYVGWLAAKHITAIACRSIASLFGGTSAHACFFRLCGAKVGAGVVFDACAEITDPACLVFEDDTHVGRHCRVSGHFVEDGHLVFSRTVLEHNSRMQPRSTLGAGVVLPANKSLGALASAGGGAVLAPEDLTDVAQSLQTKGARYREDYGLHYLIGVPVILACESMATLAAVLAVEYVATLATVERFVARHGGWASPSPVVLGTIAALAWLFHLVEAEGFFAVCVVVKKLFIGTFVEGDEQGESPIRRWLWNRLVHHSNFEAATSPYVNTELLAVKFRLLGAKIGRRVNMDFFDCVEIDLIEIGDEVVFGSSVVLVPNDGTGPSKKIRIMRGANVLDHSVLLAGAMVEANAVTGSCTLGPRDHVFKSGTVSTGSVRGAPITLKFQGDVEGGTSRLRAEDKARVLEALRRHRDPVTFYSFNAFCVVAAAALEPVNVIRGLVPVAAYFHAPHSALILAIAAFFGAELLAVCVVIATKHVVVGAFQEEDTEYYGDRHLRWVFLMSCISSVDNCLEACQGTFLAPLYFRAMGACIGKDCLLFYGAALEFDLLSIGDFASTGEGCDLTCHTVENMVVKFAPVTIGDGCATVLRFTRSDAFPHPVRVHGKLLCHMGASCICMPGATMERRSTLLEGSQVLKGETVGAYEVWRGLPAARVSDDVEADRQLVLEQKSVDWDTAHVAGVLGIGPAEAVRLLEAAERNEPRAKRVMDQLARLRGRLGSRRKFRKPLAPLERRPPHLRPPKLAQALDVSLEEARAIIRDWRRSDPEAEAQVSQARLLLLTAFADLPDIENARRVFQAAAAGETEAADLVRAYRHSSKSNFVNRTRSGSSRADRHFGSKKPGGNFGGQLDPTIPRHKQPGMYHERGILPPPPRHFYRDVTLVLSGALVVSVAINVHFLFFS